jgi:two-component sensor histidine kinase
MLAALKKFQQIKIIQDSMKALANSKQIEELEAKYESVKKDNTIEGLNNQSAIQKSNLEKINLQRNITIGGILVAIVLVALLYFAYRNKQRSNFRLQAKQDQINLQNDELSALVKEKEKLLKDKDVLLKQQESLIAEKEWLLREVHHRVKNNLQMVMSLLCTQAAYLQNTDAIDAIRNSQNRVQAISIIHQKLYSKSNLASIVMNDYVSDLVRHLCACYDCIHRNIRLKEIIEPVSLDISQAVPMGLILNEAITNAIKYAFGPDGGLIIIEGHVLSADHVKLTIADNGKGLPYDFSITETSSLGMEMMKALSKQLGGSFNISGNPGVTVTVLFKIESQLKVV